MHWRFALLALLHSLPVLAQQEYKSACWQYSFLAGHLVKSHPGFPEINAPAFVEELRFGTKLSGSKPWHKSYRYGTLGVSLAYGITGNDEILGRFVSMIPELTIPLAEKDKWRLGTSLGLGPAWFSKPYNRVDNPQNIMIGSSLAFGALAALNIEYTLSSRLSATLRTVLYHASNSHSNLPNVGMNLPVTGIGLQYRPPSEKKTGPPDTSGAFDPRLRPGARLGIAYNEFGGATGPADGPKYPIYLATLFVTKKISLVNKLYAGIEGWYNTGVYDYIISQDFYDRNQKLNSTAIALMVGHEFLLGHFGLVTQGGVYLHNPFFRDRHQRNDSKSLKAKLKTIIPARIGIQYYLYDDTRSNRHNLFAGIYIKSNLGQADFLDTGIGITF